ncbi:MAG: hypothetical protein KBT47_04825 [Armatimonadetes bacterium]|nr:hypothetical protein [Candidatus Hippobium faecium]
MKLNKILSDAVFSLAGTCVSIGVLQFFVLPWTNVAMNDPKAYGLAVAYISFFGILPTTFGGTLNNIRLIRIKDYDTSSGDYNPLLLILLALCILSTPLVSIWTEKRIDISSVCYNALAASLILANDYFIAEFRVKLNFKNVFIYNVILSAGYLAGFLIFRFYSVWQFIYIMGYFLSGLFLFAKTGFWREPVKITKYFKGTLSDLANLTVSNFLYRSLNYADKLLLYPLMGGEAVSVIFAATFFTKILSMAITPINGLVLSYLSKLKYKPDRLFGKILLFGSILCIIGYFACLFAAKPILMLLYENYASEAMKFIGLTAASTMVATFNSMINPFTLQFCPTKWQIAINGVTMFSYVVFAYWLLNIWGLWGFCLAMVLSRFIRLGIMLFVYYFRPKNR